MRLATNQSTSCGFIGDFSGNLETHMTARFVPQKFLFLTNGKLKCIRSNNGNWVHIECTVLWSLWAGPLLRNRRRRVRRIQMMTLKAWDNLGLVRPHRRPIGAQRMAKTQVYGLKAPSGSPLIAMVPNDHHQAQHSATGDGPGRLWGQLARENLLHQKYEARFVTKGCSQNDGSRLWGNVSPTANLTSLMVPSRKAAQKNLHLHQMALKTTYSSAPIDDDIYWNPPESYEQTSGGLVHKREKSLRGLKQSGWNWNRVLCDCPTEHGFT